MRGCKRDPVSRKETEDDIPILADSYYLLMFLARKHDVRMRDDKLDCNKSA